MIGQIKFSCFGVGKMDKRFTDVILRFLTGLNFYHLHFKIK